MSWICKNCETKNNDRNTTCKMCGTLKSENFSGNKTNEKIYSDENIYAKPNTNSNNVYRSDNIRKDKPIERKVYEIENQLKNKKIWLLGLSFIIIVLFFFNYIEGENHFTIVKNIMGDNGEIEQICSILLLCFVIITYLISLPRYKVRKRNTPVTFSVVSSMCTTIYCCVIWFGNSYSTIIPFLIILISWINTGIIKSIASAYKKLENAYFVSS